MFIAMNRFQVARGSEQDFEQVWLSRDSHLEKVPGFVEFHLLKGPEADDHTLYASHTVWKSHAAFEAWTKSEAFRAAHHKAGGNKPLNSKGLRFDRAWRSARPTPRKRNRLLRSGNRESFASRVVGSSSDPLNFSAEQWQRH